MEKIKIGSQYPTAKGVMVTIDGVREFSNSRFLSGDNGMDYDDDGKASFALMFSGRFRSPSNDLVMDRHDTLVESLA